MLGRRDLQDMCGQYAVVVKGHIQQEVLEIFTLVLMRLFQKGMFGGAHKSNGVSLVCDLARKGILQRWSGTSFVGH